VGIDVGVLGWCEGFRVVDLVTAYIDTDTRDYIYVANNVGLTMSRDARLIVLVRLGIPPSPTGDGTAPPANCIPALDFTPEV